MNNKQLFNKRHVGVLPGSIVNTVLPGTTNNNDVLDEINDDTSMINNEIEDNLSDVDNYSKNSEVKGTMFGIWNLSSFKTKLIIIGVFSCFVSLMFFLILFITPLMSLGIIEYKGSSSTSGYISSSYAYCDSVNVDGKIVSLEDYVAGVLQYEYSSLLNTDVDEALKAYAVSTRTYVIHSTNGCKNVIRNDEISQVFTSEISQSAKNIAIATEGKVITHNNDLFVGNFDIDVATQYLEENMNYEEILDNMYSDDIEIIDIKKLQVGNVGTEKGLDYIGTYTNVKNGKTFKNYKQYLYRSDDFTFEGKNHLASVGCGTNAAAIILSGEDSSITPMSLYIENNRQVGTYFGNHYPYGKDSFNYCNKWNNGYCTETNNNTKLSNSDMKDKFVNNLSNGGTAILFINYSADKCMVRGESWTGSQHFFTVLDYNSADNTIYISNPGTNSSSQNGWISIDEFKCVHVALLMYSE